MYVPLLDTFITPLTRIWTNNSTLKPTCCQYIETLGIYHIGKSKAQILAQRVLKYQISWVNIENKWNYYQSIENSKDTFHWALRYEGKSSRFLIFWRTKVLFCWFLWDILTASSGRRNFRLYSNSTVNNCNSLVRSSCW